MSVEEAITEFICKEFLFNDKRRLPGRDEPLIGPVIDSVGVHTLIGFLESELQIEVGDSDIVEGNFATLASLVSYAERKQDE